MSLYDSFDSSSTAVTQSRPARPPINQLPPWKLLLHNDDVNEVAYVIKTVTKVTPLDLETATARTLEADREGLALLLTTHLERAELLQSQLAGCNLTVTIEPDSP